MKKLLTINETEQLLGRLEWQNQEILRLREEVDAVKFRANTLLRSNVQAREQFCILAEHVIDGNLGSAADYLDKIDWNPGQ